jgi:hypothetical protein
MIDTEAVRGRAGTGFAKRLLPNHQSPIALMASPSSSVLSARMPDKESVP